MVILSRFPSVGFRKRYSWNRWQGKSIRDPKGIETEICSYAPLNLANWSTVHCEGVPKSSSYLLHDILGLLCPLTVPFFPLFHTKFSSTGYKEKEKCHTLRAECTYWFAFWRLMPTETRFTSRRHSISNIAFLFIFLSFWLLIGDLLYTSHFYIHIQSNYKKLCQHRNF